MEKLMQTMDSIYLTMLNKVDMQIDKFGNDVGYDKRLIADCQISYYEIKGGNKEFLNWIKEETK